MSFKVELARVIGFVKRHGAEKVLDALEGTADAGLDKLVEQVPAEFKLLAKTADSIAKDRLHATVERLEKSLADADVVQKTHIDESAGVPNDAA